MVQPEIVLLDGVKWWMTKDTTGSRITVPLCIQHNLRLRGIPGQTFNRLNRRVIHYDAHQSQNLKCDEDGGHIIKIPRTLENEELYVLNKVDAPIFAQMKVLNLDDEVIPVASEELKDTDYWVKAKVTKSKSGTRLIVWAGDKSAKNKTQLFVEPSIKRLSFDQNDDHPLEVFAKVEATFAGGIVTTLSSVEEKPASEDNKS